METNADITLYHREYDPETGVDRWTSYQYRNVNWHGKQAVAVGDKGLESAGLWAVRIPIQEDIPAICGDIVVKGLVSEEITGPSQLSGKQERFTVTAVRDNRRGSPRMRHWKLEGAG